MQIVMFVVLVGFLSAGLTAIIVIEYKDRQAFQLELSLNDRLYSVLNQLSGYSIYKHPHINDIKAKLEIIASGYASPEDTKQFAQEALELIEKGSKPQ